MDAVILTDNSFNNTGISIHRGSGAHRIATVLRRNNYKVEVVDYCLRWTLEEYQQLFQKLINDNTIFLGIGTNLFLDNDQFNTVITWFKNQYPTVKIVVGGNQVLSRNIPCVDFYIDGYAEDAVLALVKHIKYNEPLMTRYFHKKKYINANVDFGKVDTSDLSIEYTDSDFLTKNETLGLETGRGCIFKCKFCTYPLLGKRKIDYLRDPRTISAELLRNYTKWGITNYYINEDTFNDSVEKLELIHKEIVKLPFKIQFTAYARLDLLYAKPESVKLLLEMGLTGIHFGIETFDQTAGKIIGKGLTGNKLKEIILWWKSQAPDVFTVCSMINGLPEDNSCYEEINEWFSTVNVHWYWQPLYITKPSATIHTSEFTRNYQQYNLELMSDREIKQELNNLAKLEVQYKLGQHPHSYKNYLSENFRSKVAAWYNTKTGTNYFKEAQRSIVLNSTTKNNKLNAWELFNYISLGYSLDEIKQWKSLPSEEILFQRNQQLIDDYKVKKLCYNYHI